MRAWLVAVGVAGWWAGSAFGQVTDYSAGKTPAQLFATDCQACHQSARGLAKGRDQRSLASFLREHYTTKAESAGMLAGFLAGAPAGPATPEGRNAGGRQGTARVQPPKPVPGAPDSEADPGSILMPEGGAPAEHKRPPKAREAAKPPAGKGKKVDPAEAAKEAAREEAAREAAVKAKVRAYATGGEEAKPRPAGDITVPAHPGAAPGVQSAPAQAETPKAETPKAETPKAEAPKPEAPAEPKASETRSSEPNTAPAAPSGSERPASTPPG